jgi:hypothetical protein
MYVLFGGYLTVYATIIAQSSEQSNADMMEPMSESRRDYVRGVLIIPCASKYFQTMSGHVRL